MKYLKDMTHDELHTLCTTLFNKLAVIEGLQAEEYAKKHYDIEWTSQDVMNDYKNILQDVIKEFNFEDWRAVIRTDSWHIVEERCKALPNFEKNSYNDWVAVVHWHFR